MADSKKLAGLIGPVIVAMTVSEALNLHIWAANIPAVTYLNGIILFTAGLAIVRAHNRWVAGWPVLVTLAGWFGLALGLFRILLPELQPGGSNFMTYAVIAILCAGGLVITYKAYTGTSDG
jgi:hypothetical protein